MARFQRLVAAVALIAGLIGVLACVVILVGAFVANAGLRGVTNSAYADVDELFSRGQARVHELRSVVGTANGTASDLQASLAAWGARDTEVNLTQELNDRFALDSKAGAVASALSEAESLAELSADSLKLLRRGTEIANQAGASIEMPAIESMQQRVDQLRSRIRETEEDLTQLSTWLRDEADGRELRSQLGSAAQLLVRVLDKLETIHTSLDRLDESLAETRETIAGTERRVINWIHVATAAVIFFSLWALAGQFSLGRYGWIKLRQ